MSKDLFLSAEKLLKENGFFSNRAVGTSMFPMLRSGKDIIDIIPPVFPLKNNDVVLYRVKGFDKLILHRIIKKPQGKTYVIRGDNTYRNEFVNESDIVGVLEGFYRNGKYHNCKKDVSYHIYVFFMRALYPVRYFWVFFLRRAISKIKRTVKKIIK